MTEGPMAPSLAILHDINAVISVRYLGDACYSAAEIAAASSEPCCQCAFWVTNAECRDDDSDGTFVCECEAGYYGNDNGTICTARKYIILNLNE